jgi:hypothetical protein
MNLGAAVLVQKTFGGLWGREMPDAIVSVCLLFSKAVSTACKEKD